VKPCPVAHWCPWRTCRWWSHQQRWCASQGSSVWTCWGTRCPWGDPKQGWQGRLLDVDMNDQRAVLGNKVLTHTSQMYL
jgi:hypothetical protein